MPKQRTTFLVRDPSSTHPDNFDFSSTSFSIKSLPAAREDRLTFGFHELPAELWNVLKQCNEVHIRWTTGKAYSSVNPYASRLPAGLHAFVSPQRDAIPDDICGSIKAAFGVHDCNGFKESFTHIPGIYQFYSPSTSIAPLRTHLTELLCAEHDAKCTQQLEVLQDVDYIDIDYDAVSQSLVLSAFREEPVTPWRETISMRRPGEANIEIGVLGLERPLDDESLTLGGFLFVIGENQELEPVMFTFPARHHKYPATYSVTAVQPTGLHPKLQLHLRGPRAVQLEPPDEDCTLNAYFTLPKSVFVDRYQLSSSNPQLLSSLNITRLRDLRGESDLEAPVWAPSRWGSSALVEIATNAAGEGLTVEMPLHLRYHEPAFNQTSREVRLPWPSIFWACRSEEWSKMGNNPFDRVRLGWEASFPEQTMFYHLSPSAESATWTEVEVPVLDLQRAQMIKVGTVAAVVAGFLWVLWKTVRPLRRETKEAHPKTE